MRHTLAVLTSLAVAVMGCASEKQAESFSAFEKCLIGKTPANDTELAQRLRSSELALRKAPAITTAADWPKRCERHAEALYRSLGTSTETALLRRELTAQLGCGDKPGSCRFPEEGVVLSSPVALWQGANAAALRRVEVAGVDAPPPLEDSQLGTVWPELAPPEWQVGATRTAPDGGTWLLLRARSGRTPVRLCELPVHTNRQASYGEARCRVPHVNIPVVPTHNVTLTEYDGLPVLVGLTEEGRRGFVFDTGRPLPVRGEASREVSQGLAAERGANDEGLEAYALADGLEGKPMKLATESLVSAPVPVGPFLAWVEQDQQQDVLVVNKADPKRRLERVAQLPGPWGATPLNVCRHAKGWVVASWGMAKGIRGATATADSDGSRVTLTFYDSAEGRWSESRVGACLTCGRSSHPHGARKRNGASPGRGLTTSRDRSWVASPAGPPSARRLNRHGLRWALRRG